MPKIMCSLRPFVMQFSVLFSDKLDDTISKDPYLNYGLVYFLMPFVVGVLA